MTEVIAKRALDPEQLDSAVVYELLGSCIVPRPIGLLSTVDRDGVFNVAPFSFFNGLAPVPPLLGVSVGPVLATQQRKDTLTNVTDTGEFVWNLVTETLVKPITVCAEPHASAVSEFDAAGLTPIPSTLVRPPRVAESPVNMECRVVMIMPLPSSTYTLVIGRVCQIHVALDLWVPDGRIDSRALAAVGDMDGANYTRTGELFAVGQERY